MGNNIIPFPSSKTLRSMVTVPVTWIVCDLEYVKSTLDNKWHVIEFALWDIYADKLIYQTVVKPKGDFHLSQWRQSHGYSDEDLRNAITMEELDNHLQYLLRSFMLCFWNKENDLKNYPQLQTYAYGTRCAMQRYSSTYGSYDPNFGDRRYAKLVNASADAGFSLQQDEFFHNAETDAKACAHVWRYCDEMDLPSPSIDLDLVLRKEVEMLVQESVQQKDDEIQHKGGEIILLENALHEKNLALEEGIEEEKEEVEDPFPF